MDCPCELRVGAAAARWVNAWDAIAAARNVIGAPSGLVEWALNAAAVIGIAVPSGLGAGMASAGGARMSSANGAPDCIGAARCCVASAPTRFITSAAAPTTALSARVGMLGDDGGCRGEEGTSGVFGGIGVVVEVRQP